MTRADATFEALRRLATLAEVAHEALISAANEIAEHENTLSRYDRKWLSPKKAAEELRAAIDAAQPILDAGEEE